MRRRCGTRRGRSEYVGRVIAGTHDEVTGGHASWLACLATPGELDGVHHTWDLVAIWWQIMVPQALVPALARVPRPSSDWTLWHHLVALVLVAVAFAAAEAIFGGASQRCLAGT